MRLLFCLLQILNRVQDDICFLLKGDFVLLCN